VTESLRETLESAIEQHSEPAPEPTLEPVAAPEPVAAAPDLAAEPAPSPGRARDESGRFAPKPKEAPEGAPAAPAKPVVAGGMKPAAVSPAAVGSPAAPEPKPTAKPPQSWSPAAREKWANVPAEIQEHVLKREGEVTRALQESAKARQFETEFRETFRPFEGFMAAAGHTPMESLRSLAQTAAALQTAPPAHRAQIVAQIINGYGVDLGALNAALQGAPVPQQQSQSVDPSQIAQQVRQSLLEEIQGQREQKLASEWETKVSGYAEKFEFFDDVRDDMADLSAVWSKRNPGKLPDDATVEKWYNQSVALHPEVSGVVQQRKAAEAAKVQIASTQRSKAAGSSIKPIPVESVTRSTGRRSIREDVEAAIAAQRA
jgi:hypothetical protein